MTTRTPKGMPSQSPWSSFIMCGCILVGVLTAGLVGDAVDQHPSTLKMFFWLFLGWIGGMFAGIPLSERIDAEHRRRHQTEQRAAEEKASEGRRQLWHDRENAVQAAAAALPNMVDEDSLQNEDGDYIWPDDLFNELFEIPDLVVPYTTSDGDRAEVRFWSKGYVAEQAKDARYQRHRAEVDADRARWCLKDAERARQQAAERAEAEARERRLSAVMTIPLDELVRRKP